MDESKGNQEGKNVINNREQEKEQTTDSEATPSNRKREKNIIKIQEREKGGGKVIARG